MSRNEIIKEIENNKEFHDFDDRVIDRNHYEEKLMNYENLNYDEIDKLVMYWRDCCKEIEKVIDIFNRIDGKEWDKERL